MKLKQDISKTLNRVTRPISFFKKSSLHYLFQDISIQTSLVIATVLSVFYILYLFPFNFLMGKGGFFEQVDMLVSLSGWFSFRADKWHFPVLYTRLLNAPEGTTIALTNSIPLMGLLLKPIQHWFSKDFHYFGSWVGIAYLAQAMSATFAIRSLGQHTILAAIASSSMGLMMPILLWQTVNIPLMSQAYLLLGIALYFNGLKDTHSYQRTLYCFTVLLSLSLLTHPYLCVMSSAFYLAFLVDCVRKSPKYQSLILVNLVVTALCMMMLLIIGGYLTQPIRAQGYGRYAMNLLAPFSGGKLGYSLTHIPHGQHRGFNYLGMGTLASLLITVVMYRQSFIKVIAHYRTLFILLTIFMTFSISNQIFYGKQLIIRYPLFFPFTLITGMLPYSGRLFWPCAYTLMTVGLAGVFNLKDKTLSALFTFLILTIQFYDTLPLRYSLYRAVRKPPVISSNWHRLIRTVSAVELYPAYGCSHHTLNHIAFWQALATQHQRSINTAYTAASTQVHCLTKNRPFKQPINKNRLYVVAKEQRKLPYYINLAMEEGWCKKTDQGMLCIKNTNDDWWKNYFLQDAMSSIPKKTSKQMKKPNMKKKKDDLDWPEGVD